MMGSFRLFVVDPLAIMTAGLSLACGSSEPRKVAELPPALVDTPSVPQTTPALGGSIEGVYSNAHTVRSVDNVDEAVEDVVEIVVYDPTHVFFRIATHFDIGHSCGVHGIATLEHGAFVYQSRQLPLSNTRPCTLKVEATVNELRISDRLEPHGESTCREYCGVRGDLSDVAISRMHRRAVQDTAALKSSTDFAEAVAEFNSKILSR
jgi:hypothetical protein